jgi:hypothetical protein
MHSSMWVTRQRVWLIQGSAVSVSYDKRIWFVEGHNL